MIFAIVLMLIGVILFGIFAYTFHEFTTAITINESIGQVNLADAVGSTLGKLDVAMLNSLDWWGLALIFGCIIGLFLSSYWLSGESPKLFLIIDIIILVLAFILAVYLSQTYKLFLEATAGIDTFTTYMPKSSKFLLNLPLFVGVIGAINFILHYSGIPKNRKDTPQTDVSMPDFQ
ncbi:MAG: hypothetical protein WC711_04015 [Candidatus Staskawiczbacteria bacterium]